MTINVKTVGVVGLGYVGLPLAVEFGKKLPTVGFDLSARKIASYQKYHDPMGELSGEDMRAATLLSYSADPSILSQADVIIVAVPTPVDVAHVPDFSPLMAASTIVGKHMKKGAIVVFESTVYPGATEEVCIPLLEQHSGKRWMLDFHVGYSPERVNPGDKERTITKIMKVVSGDDASTLKIIGDLYASVITAGVYRASSIKVAEAAKVIENTQRDLNIALINELAMIFGKIGIDTSEVLKAAGTKWNFLNFKPGLVGGHCIGVDPYYLTHKAEKSGYHPQVILAGRRINDNMASYVAQSTVKEMIAANRNLKNARVLIMGLTFKENVADIRNSKVYDIFLELERFGLKPVVWDPIANPAEAKQEYGIDLIRLEELDRVDAVVAAVTHRQILELDLNELVRKAGFGAPFIDVKSAFNREHLSELGFKVWRL